MLLECWWRETKPCNADDFQLFITDWGICYTFNNPANRSDVLQFNQAGSGSGLYLRLNIEQDEYFSFKNRGGAGFKVNCILQMELFNGSQLAKMKKSIHDMSLP